MQIQKNKGYLYAIFASVLFGVSTPLAKIILKNQDPILTAGILYFGSGCGLGILFIFRHFFIRIKSESNLKIKDYKWLVGAIFFGGILGPIFLMKGLIISDAGSASLLLNMEGVLTAGLAWFVFKEHFDRKIALGMLSIVAGGCVLSWKGSFNLDHFSGPLFIILACFSWAIDNNLTKKISESDPMQIAMLKSLVAGFINIVIGLLFNANIPNANSIIFTSFIGFLGYGASLFFFVISLRQIGTARTGAYFSIAPFIGTAVAILFLGEGLTIQIAIASALMGIGIWLHLIEKHIHNHVHEEIEHEHKHVHDEHHQHTHLTNDPISEPHSHKHKHEAIKHNHEHFPDSHHNHKH